jgi:hypothetical protein
MMQLVWVQNLIGFVKGQFPADERWTSIFVRELEALSLTSPPATKGVTEALRAIVDFCDDPNGSESNESLGMGLARLLPAAREALSTPAAPELAVGWVPTHQHVKRGSKYRLDGYGEIQTDMLLTDYAKVAIYRAEDGTTWVRPVSEFEDGRFVALSSVREP